MRGSFSRFLPLFLWVAIDMVLWGFLSEYLNTVSVPGMDFVPKLLGAVLLWDFLTRVMQGVTIAFLEDVWSRNFLNFFATPLSVSEYVGGLVVTSILTSSVGLAVMLALATAVFGLSFLSFGLLAVPFIAILFVTGISLGVLGIAMVLRLGPASEWFIWPIPIMISPFAGVFYPVSILPAWMRAVSYALPPSYVFEGMRASLASGTVSAGSLAVGGALSAAYLGLAFQVFRSTYRHAIRTGLIARYSAESVA
ncbi:MAG TPA: ABC transporter permease [Fibrobacteria bacterium]|nr:ABC transporter permease [Fibrobacteria bacterium]